MESTRRAAPDPSDAPPGEPRSLGELFRALSDDAAVLVRQEIALVRTELGTSLSEARRSGTRIAIGGALAAVGTLAIVAGVIILVGGLLGGVYWGAALGVGALLLLAGGGVAYAGVRDARRASLRPEETLDSLRVTGEWARDEAAEFREAVAEAPRNGNGTARAPGVAGARRFAARRSAGGTAISVVRDGGEGRGRRDGAHEEDEGLARSLIRRFQEDDVLNVAAGMAFYAFLALPPTLLVVFALTGFFGGEGAAQWITQQLTNALPDEASQWIDTFVENVVLTNAPGPFSIGLIVALWASSNVFMSIARALNIAYDVEEARSFVKQRALALGVMLFFAVFALAGSAAILMGPQIADALDLFGVANAVWSVAQWIVPLLLLVAALVVTYYVLPARDQKRQLRQILIGSAAAAVLWIVASAAFRLYITNFGNYNETYGVLGGVIILLLWFYITMVVILLGGELAAELERRAVR